ncbi:helix-turn-helix domain-containing protein [Halovenus sp. WSH3]|uniref:Helix-turn-helix domain-containing protein n=1 Tax=Halovenus carboxidivorans TaxID=2692199 RepID=A0A6B0TBK4_9EURY|nr:helix-turn-helix domain-containing protein [Halovenus carboxidivorans]MXR53013.1 helix-turn-helix domain-containing protein [Halovenus carboxidivorans]
MRETHGDSSTATHSAAAVLDALGDGDSRDILAALARGPKVVPELVDVCDVSRATAYRKLDRLSAAGLVDGQPRFRPDSRTRTEYVASLGGVTVTFGNDGPRRKLSLGGGKPLATDGGQPSSPEPDHRHLRELFCEVTGAEQVVERQDDTQRRLSETADETVVTDAAEVSRADGLDDTLPEADGSE